MSLGEDMSLHGKKKIKEKHFKNKFQLAINSRIERLSERGTMVNTAARKV